MVGANSAHSVTGSRNPDQPQANGSSPPTAEPAIQPTAKKAPTTPSPTTKGNPGPTPSIPRLSRRAWNYDKFYYPTPDGDHWKKVYEKAGEFDKEFCSGWNSEIDSLLTFAGLFSAVVTAFTVESYKLLQPDPQDITNRILSNVSAQLAGRNATELPSGFTPSPSSVLTAALVGILCKQWLRHYHQDISKPPKEALAIRQLRYDSLLRCRVMEILGALPVLLGLGLILFFVGLIDFLQSFDVRVLIPVAVLIGIGFAFLVVTTLVPVFQYLAFVGRPWQRSSSQAMPSEIPSSSAPLPRSSEGPSSSKRPSSAPPLFAFKSPQSLAVLHLITWLFPLEGKLKFPNWASLELRCLPGYFGSYVKRALTWLDEAHPYTYSLDMAYQMSLCLQDIAEDVILSTADTNRTRWSPNAAVIKLFHNLSLADKGIIAVKYLPEHAPVIMSFDQNFTVLKRLIRTLNASSHEMPSLKPLDFSLVQLSFQADGRQELVEQVHEVIWQRAILFRNLLSGGRWTGLAIPTKERIEKIMRLLRGSGEVDLTGIPREVQHVSKNLKIFTDEDLDSIFNTLRTWMDWHPHDAVTPGYCWIAMTSQLKPHGLDEALRDRPPVRNFMAVLDSRLQMETGVEYLCRGYDDEREEEFDSVFMALYAWNERNPQDTQSFIRCRRLLTATLDSHHLERARQYQSFRDFETFLEAQTPGDGDAAEEGLVRDP
ncbi:hypothetical protein BD779DRAFT_1472235 [Infundibulicybe gibba]|nr:hypothetical protein BD779DRAFT_1472235 [Infundibulicybe gibba]